MIIFVNIILGILSLLAFLGIIGGIFEIKERGYFIKEDFNTLFVLFMIFACGSTSIILRIFLSCRNP